MDTKTELFITKAKSIHGDKYDYSNTIYVNQRTLLMIICKEHGEFSQLPQTHLIGYGCKYCSGKYKHSTADFIKSAKKIHNNKYDYSKVEYTNSKSKVCIICYKHGEFWQTPNDHLDGCGCPICGGKIKITTEDIINRAKSVHGDKYDYSKTKYIDSRTKITIICPKHGEFLQKPHNHINLRQGCPKCKELSKGQLELFKRLTKALPNEQIIWEYSSDWLGKLKIDIYIPSYKIAVEYDGVQHVKPIKWFGGIDSFNKAKERDLRKESLCKDNGVCLIRVPYDVTFSSFDSVINNIKNIINNGRL